jgi:predicted small lipoprotein YifL
MSRVIHSIVIAAMVFALAACGANAPAAAPPAPPTIAPTIAAATMPSAVPTAAPAAASDHAQALLGAWTATVTKEDLLRVVPDYKREHLCENSGIFVWTFNADGTFSGDQPAALEGCPKPEQPHLEGTWSTQGNLITLGKGSPEEMVYEWTVKDDMLSFTYRSGGCIPCRATDTANPWKRMK